MFVSFTNFTLNWSGQATVKRSHVSRAWKHFIIGNIIMGVKLFEVFFEVSFIEIEGIKTKKVKIIVSSPKCSYV